MLKHQLIQFTVMVIIGMLFNPMNMLAYKFDHLLSSLTLFYGGLLMASNMIWGHEIIHYLSMGHFNIRLFSFGVLLSLFVVIFLLRKQLFVTPKQWYKRMIPHHSTALTTSSILLKNNKDFVNKNPKLNKLVNDIIKTQESEIKIMKNMLKK
jgi:hypothetical protein